MTILTRVTGKVFGSQAPANEIGVFGSAKAGNPTLDSNVANIQGGVAYLQGWGSGIVSAQNFPPMEEVTGVLKTISYQACYALQSGVPIYDANTEYGKGDIVKSTNGAQLEFYVAIQDVTDNGVSNIGKWGNATFWQKALIVGEREIGVPQITLNPLSLPTNCIWLEGQVLAQSNYPNLFSIYTTTYNTGDEGAGNFRVPDFRDRYFCGVVNGNETTMGYISAGLPNLGLSTSSSGAHTHDAGTYRIRGTIEAKSLCENLSVSGAFTNEGSSTKAPPAEGQGTCKKIGIDAKKGNGWTGSSGSSGAHTHTITSSNALVGSSSTVKVAGVKVRVYTRYQ